jgi:uncharacterized protein
MAEETTGAAPQPTGEPKPTGKDSTNMAMLCHLCGIIMFFGLIGSVIIWLTKKDQDAFVDDQGKEAINWQITAVIGYMIGVVTWCILIGPFVILATFLCNLVVSIMGAIAASNGKKYRYPFALRLLK